MDSDKLDESESFDTYPVRSEEKLATFIHQKLARSLIEFIEFHANDEIKLIGCYDVADGIEAIQIAFPTGTHQAPAHDVRPVEPLLLVFFENDAPLIASLRRSFPATQHTYGLEVDAAIDAQLALCIDDRAWEDASSDYNGAEIVRRIASWFQRAITGKMNDELQFRDPVFLPSSASIIVSFELERQILTQDALPVFLAISQGDVNSKTFFAHRYDDAPAPADQKVWTPFISVSLAREANNAGAMWRAPSNLGQLQRSVSASNNDLLELLRDKLGEFWRSLTGSNLERLKKSNLLIHVAINNKNLERYESFWLLALKSVAEIAVGLGILLPPNTDFGSDYVLRLSPGDIDENFLADIPLLSANSYKQFSSEFARAMSAQECIAKHAAIVGLGSIGSQIAVNLAREGAFDQLTLIDGDRLLPHNLARHVLTSDSVSHLKSSEMANLIKSISPKYPVAAISTKLDLSDPESESRQALAAASIVLDLTASVGASREISDFCGRSRAISAFFNPSGNAYVVLAEDDANLCDLANLESEYYAQIAQEEIFADHLKNPDRVLVSSGQCRSVSNRLSASDAALLSAAACKSIKTALEDPAPSISIGTVANDGSLKNHRFNVAANTSMIQVDNWTIRMTGNVEARLRSARTAALPNETGGVLLGVVDHKRKRIEISISLLPPTDSACSPTDFLRGVRDLRNSIDRVTDRVMHQLTYVGEWHSHPKGATAFPSSIDYKQLDALASDLAPENRPGVMVIVGEQESRIHVRGQ